MALLTVIGRGVRVRGRVTGEADLTIEGHVEGEITIAGDVTVETGGLVGANVQGRVVIVRGAVRGDVTGEELVRLEDGARVVGDLRAPRVAIAQGALVRGLVQTGSASGSTARAKAASPARQAPATATKQAAAPPAASVRQVSPSTPRTITSAATQKASPAPHVQQASAQRRPPPPVVPALKKGAKAALKKKAT